MLEGCAFAYCAVLQRLHSRHFGDQNLLAQQSERQPQRKRIDEGNDTVASGFLTTKPTVIAFDPATQQGARRGIRIAIALQLRLN
jgi:hypothetical protein